MCENYDVNTEPKTKNKAKKSLAHASLLLPCYVPAVFFMRKLEDVCKKSPTYRYACGK